MLSTSSRLLHTPVYGGDAIVKSNGTYVIIDFNDWPSFSRCREEMVMCFGEDGIRKRQPKSSKKKGCTDRGTEGDRRLFVIPSVNVQHDSPQSPK